VYIVSEAVGRILAFLKRRLHGLERHVSEGATQLRLEVAALVAMSVAHAVVEGGVVRFDACLAVASEEMVASMLSSTSLRG
jgi:hypothetical protein